MSTRDTAPNRAPQTEWFLGLMKSKAPSVRIRIPETIPAKKRGVSLKTTIVEMRIQDPAATANPKASPGLRYMGCPLPVSRLSSYCRFARLAQTRFIVLRQTREAVLFLVFLFLD